MNLKVKKMHQDAILPTVGHTGDGGIDMYSTETVTFPPGAQISVPTGIAMEIPDGYVGLVWDKSSVAFKQGLKVMGGVIDAPYRGEIIISLYNTTDQEQVLEKGKKVAQVLIQKVEQCTFEEVDTLSDTTRGVDGWGSTGK